MIDLEKLGDFMIAQQEAEDKGEHSFPCPICGETVIFGRARGNNHLHCSCPGCGIRMAE